MIHGGMRQAVVYEVYNSIMLRWWHDYIDYLVVDNGIRKAGGGQDEGVVAGEGYVEHQIEEVQLQLHRDVLHENKCVEKN